jgi:hypothetical protein
VLAADHPATANPRAYLICAVCLKRELTVALLALQLGETEAAEQIIAKIRHELDRRIKTAVAADRGRVQ